MYLLVVLSALIASCGGVIISGIHTRHNMCSSTIYECSDGSYPWCEGDYSHHCCFDSDSPPPGSVCSATDRECVYVCCGPPQHPCGWGCCDPPTPSPPKTNPPAPPPPKTNPPAKSSPSPVTIPSSDHHSTNYHSTNIKTENTVSDSSKTNSPDAGNFMKNWIYIVIGLVITTSLIFAIYLFSGSTCNHCCNHMCCNAGYERV